MRERTCAVGGLREELGALEGAVLICSVSYESRCLTIPAALAESKLGVVLVCENENHIGLHSGQGDQLRGILKGPKKDVWLSTVDSLKTGDSFVEALEEEQQRGRFLVDLSTFTHEGMLILVRALYEYRLLERCTFLYALAREYSVGDKGAAKWLSRGVGDIRSVLGYPGTILPSRPLHLIVLVGLEYQRTVDLIGRFEPSVISLGRGFRPSRNAKRIGGTRSHFSRVKAIFSEAQEFEFPALDVGGAMTSVEDSVDSQGSYACVIAPMNTKLSTLAVALLGCARPEIQLCYAQAVVYNYQHYSLPGEQVVIVDELTADSN